MLLFQVCGQMERKRNKYRVVGTVTLETERLILRRFQESDVEGVYKNWGHQKELYKFLPWEAHKDIEETLNIVRYCTEALKRIVQYMKEINSKRIREIRGTNDVNNPALGKVFQNAGFTFYGIEYLYSESLKKNVDMSV